MMARELSTLELSADRRRRRPSPGVAQQQRARAGREEGEDRHLPLELFAGFLDRLRSTPDGDGNLLDHSMFLYGSGMSNGNLHTHDNLPILWSAAPPAGSRAIATSRCKANTPLSNVMMAVLDKAGRGDRKFGDSSGRIDAVEHPVRRPEGRIARLPVRHYDCAPLLAAVHCRGVPPRRRRRRSQRSEPRQGRCGAARAARRCERARRRRHDGAPLGGALERPGDGEAAAPRRRQRQGGQPLRRHAAARGRAPSATPR